MSAPGNGPSTAWGACTKMVEAATQATAKACSPPAAAPPTASVPNWDAMANSFAALSSALAWGATILGAAALLVGFAWMRIVSDRARKEARTIAEKEARTVAEEAKKIADIEARKEAKACAQAYIQSWLADEAPGIIQKHLELLNPPKIGSGDDLNTTDEMGEKA